MFLLNLESFSVCMFVFLSFSVSSMIFSVCWFSVLVQQKFFLSVNFCCWFNVSLTLLMFVCQFVLSFPVSVLRRWRHTERFCWRLESLQRSVVFLFSALFPSFPTFFFFLSASVLHRHSCVSAPEQTSLSPLNHPPSPPPSLSGCFFFFSGVCRRAAACFWHLNFFSFFLFVFWFCSDRSHNTSPLVSEPQTWSETLKKLGLFSETPRCCCQSDHPPL